VLWLIYRQINTTVKLFFFNIQRCTAPYLSRWNFKLCTTSALFCRKFQRCKLSSAVTVINAPSFIRNSTWTTAASNSCLTCASTPGLPILYYTLIKENRGMNNKITVQNKIMTITLFIYSITIYIFKRSTQCSSWWISGKYAKN